jgi:hypothetical protein
MIVISYSFQTDFLSSLAYLLLGLCDLITFAVVVWIIAHELKHLQEASDSFPSKRLLEPLQPTTTTNLRPSLCSSDKTEMHQKTLRSSRSEGGADRNTFAFGQRKSEVDFVPYIEERDAPHISINSNFDD